MKIIQIAAVGIEDGPLFGLGSDGRLYYWHHGDPIYAKDPSGIKHRVGTRNTGWKLEMEGTRYVHPEFKNGFPEGWVIE